MNETHLEVVCRNCGEQVSPYVTECPYCGTRLRKRAPKLERQGEGFALHEPIRKRIRSAAARAGGEGAGRPFATLAVLLVPALLLIVQRAAGLRLDEAGAIFGGIDGEWWRAAAAPFAYSDVGYLFACGLAVSIFAPGLERRIGSLATFMLLVAAGALGMLAADAAASAGLDEFLIAAGGNGIALGALGAWWMIRRGEAARGGEPADRIGVTVVGIALLLLPLAEDSADPIAGVAGLVVGVVAGWIAARAGVGER